MNLPVNGSFEESSSIKEEAKFAHDTKRFVIVADIS